MRRAPRITVVVLMLSASWSTVTARAQTPSPGDPAYRAGGIILGAPPATAPLAAPAPPTAPQGGPVQGAALQVPELQLTTQVAFGRPVDSVTAFPPDHPAIFVWFRYAGAPPGSTLIARLVFLARAGEIEAGHTTGQVSKPDDVGYFKFTAPSDGWPEGRYRLDLIVNGAAVRAQEFQVRRAR